MPRERTSLDEILASQDWADLSRRLTLYAHVRLRKASWETAEEVAQEAIARALDPAYAAWDRDRHPDLFDFLGHLVNGLVANHRRLGARRGKHVSLRDDEASHDDELEELPQIDGEDDAGDSGSPPPDAVHASDPRTPEDLLSAGVRTAREAEVLALLRQRLASRPLCLALLDRIKAGTSRPSADAEALGVTPSEIYTARQQLMRQARSLSRELATNEASDKADK